MRDDAPRRLQPGEPVVEAGDHHVADAVEQRGERAAACRRRRGRAGGRRCGRQRAGRAGWRRRRHDPRRDLGVRAQRGERVGGAGDQRGHHHQGELGVAPLPGERASRAISAGGELVGGGHGALVVVAPVGTAAPPCCVRVDRGAVGIGRRRRWTWSSSSRSSSWSSSWWSSRSSLMNWAASSWSRTRAWSSICAARSGSSCVARRAAGVLGGRVEPEHAAVLAAVDDRLALAVERDEVAAACPRGEDHHGDDDGGRRGERDGELGEARPLRWRLVRRRRRCARGVPVASAGASGSSGERTGGRGARGRRRPRSAPRRSRASGRVDRHRRARRRRSR